VLKHFARITKPARMSGIDTKAVDEYVAARRSEKMKGGKPSPDGRTPSPATLNRELRYLRLVFRKAVRWKYLRECPEMLFLREPGKPPTYVTPEHFAAIYKAADVAAMPEGQAYSAADWWRALLVTAYMTGWRIGQILALRWGDVDLERATAFSRADDNKGKRDVLLPLHSLVVDHLRRIKSFSPLVFPCPFGQRKLYEPLKAIQTAAKVKPHHGKGHYGFHDFRRAFATMNAERLTADAAAADADDAEAID
jgi:integrase